MLWNIRYQIVKFFYFRNFQSQFWIKRWAAL